MPESLASKAQPSPCLLSVSPAPRPPPRLSTQRSFAQQTLWRKTVLSLSPRSSQKTGDRRYPNTSAREEDIIRREQRWRGGAPGDFSDQPPVKQRPHTGVRAELGEQSQGHFQHPVPVPPPLLPTPCVLPWLVRAPVSDRFPLQAGMTVTFGQPSPAGFICDPLLACFNGLVPP